jgi:hypothetical protein
MFISFSFLILIYYLYETSKHDYKVWDVNTVTTADFTVEYIITEETWNNFLKKPEVNTNGNKMISFKKYIKTKFE